MKKLGGVPENNLGGTSLPVRDPCFLFFPWGATRVSASYGTAAGQH